VKDSASNRSAAVRADDLMCQDFTQVKKTVCATNLAARTVTIEREALRREVGFPACQRI
jgi:hypothetical protein